MLNSKAFVAIGLMGLTAAGCAGLYRSDFGRYTGEVRPIVEPVEVRYRPLPLSRGKMNGDFHIRIGGDSGSSRSSDDISISITQMGDRLLATCSVDRSTMDGQSIEERLVSGRVLMTDRGKFIEESYEWNGQTAYGGSKPFVDARANTHGCFPSLPEDPVTSGSTLILGGMMIDDIIRQLGADVTDGTEPQLMSTVRGITTYEGRDALVVDMAMSASMGVEGHDLVISSQGFHLVDVNSGVILRFETAGNASFTHEGQPGTMRTRMSYRLETP